MIESIEYETCKKMLSNLSEKIGAGTIFPQLRLASPWKEFPVSLVLFREFLHWKQAYKQVNKNSKKTKKVEERKWEKLKPKSLRPLGTFSSKSPNFDGKIER